MIGGGWTAGLDERHKLSRALRSSVEGNLWVASRVVPALADLHAIRIWAGMNVNIDRAPILGEVPGRPGFYNCVSSNGYTLAPVLGRLTAEMFAGRSTSLPVEAYSIRRSIEDRGIDQRFAPGTRRLGPIAPLEQAAPAEPLMRPRP